MIFDKIMIGINNNSRESIRVQYDVNQMATYSVIATVASLRTSMRLCLELQFEREHAPVL